MGSRRTYLALRRRAAIALAVWAVAFAILAVAAAVPQGPLAALTVDDAYPSVGQAVHFNASGSAAHDAGQGRIVSYRFAFGDGQTTGVQASPFAEHAYASAGAFVATVTVTDGRGAQGTASVTVHPGVAPPPPTPAPDLVPIQATADPSSPEVNHTVRATVVVLNRGGGAASAATVEAYDVPPNGTARFVGNASLAGPIAPSATASATLGPFVLSVAGNHTLRFLVANVTPAETSAANNELDLRVSVLPGPATNPPGGGGEGGGGGAPLSPLAVGLGIAAVAAGAGAAFLFLRRPPRGPLEPPPASPPDRSPPPIWPP